MIGISSPIEILLMARKTIPRRAPKYTVAMTTITANRGVCTHQRKACRVFKPGINPCSNRAAVTGFTAHRKTGQLVIRIGCCFIILAMADAALQRHIDKLAFALHCVTIIAADVLVPAEQRKPRGLMNNGYFCDIGPGLKRVATLTMRAKRAVVRIGVTSLAIA
jgi:hypothetical protein